MSESVSEVQLHAFLGSR